MLCKILMVLLLLNGIFTFFFGLCNLDRKEGPQVLTGGIILGMMLFLGVCCTLPPKDPEVRELEARQQLQNWLDDATRDRRLRGSGYYYRSRPDRDYSSSSY